MPQKIFYFLFYNIEICHVLFKKIKCLGIIKMNYECLRCGHKTFKKYNLIKHYKRKRICKPIFNDFSQETCMEMFEDGIKTQVELLKNRLKKKDILNEKDFLKEQIKFLQEQNKVLIDQNKEFIKKIGNNITNSTINITNNYTINDYKNTDYAIVSEKELQKCIKRNGILDIVKLFKTVHFNEKYPENHNIKIENANNKRLLVLEDKKFIEKGRGLKAISRIVRDEINMAELNANDNEDDNMEIAIDNFATKYEGSLDNKDQNEKLFTLMYNKRQLVNKTNSEIITN